MESTQLRPTDSTQVTGRLEELTCARASGRQQNGDNNTHTSCNYGEDEVR